MDVSLSGSSRDLFLVESALVVLFCLNTREDSASLSEW